MQFQVYKNPSCPTSHIKAPLSQESTQANSNIQPYKASENQITHDIKENTVSNRHHSSQQPIQYIDMTIAEVVRASR